jgi:hypothetical protein
MKYTIALDFFRSDAPHKEIAPLLTKVCQELAHIEGVHITLISNNFIGGRRLLYTNHSEATE